HVGTPLWSKGRSRAPLRVGCRPAGLRDYIRPAPRAAARRDRRAPQATARGGQAIGDGGGPPPGDRGAPSRSALRQEKRGERWLDAQSWLVLDFGGTLPAPP